VQDPGTFAVGNAVPGRRRLRTFQPLAEDDGPGGFGGLVILILDQQLIAIALESRIQRFTAVPVFQIKTYARTDVAAQSAWRYDFLERERSAKSSRNPHRPRPTKKPGFN